VSEIDREMYVVLGVAAGVFFLVAGMRAFSLRRYGPLFDRSSRQGSRITGLYSGRGAEIALLSGNHSTSDPAALRISLECAAPLEVDAVRESLATALRKTLGIQPDRKTGVENLDRLFAFQFYDRRKMEDCVGRLEVRESFVALADLGARSVRLRDARVTVEVPTRFIVPPGVERLRQILAAMLTLGSAMESALSAEMRGSALTSDQAVASGSDEAETETRAPKSRPDGMAIAGPVLAGVLFVAMLTAFLIVGSFWDFDGKVPWRARLAIVNARFPIVAVLTGLSGFLAALLAPRRPMLWSFLLSWPLILHGVLAWILYIVLRGSGIPDIGKELSDQGEFVRAALTAATAAPAVALGSGFLGAVLGARVSGAADRL
jgi:hypothetical protein